MIGTLTLWLADIDTTIEWHFGDEVTMLKRSRGGLLMRVARMRRADFIREVEAMQRRQRAASAPPREDGGTT